VTGQQFTGEDFLNNLASIRSRIASAGGDLDKIRVIAVSKGQPIESIRVAIECGHREFGENYADELVAKATELGSDSLAVWHFQGRLQTNKINRLRPHVSLWQTVDTAERAVALANRVPGATVLIQMDATEGDGDRSGALPRDVPVVVNAAQKAGLHVVGLMTVAPLKDLPNSADRAFHQLCTLADSLGLSERSIGMSDDLEVAVRSGSTMVRVGSALFGIRS
jgi:PLP dependent protein